MSNEIGTLNEGSLHAGLKQWLWQPGDRVEVPVGGFVVDLVRGNQLIEIQTTSFAAMGRKLDHLLEEVHLFGKRQRVGAKRSQHERNLRSYIRTQLKQGEAADGAVVARNHFSAP